ncbi:MAG: class I SAM-dependent methyltransferase [Deltaproteobacteria bacterium]|nr:class I SAM-dependent methyltransferase [Deltaproteobacteria bacterium]
MPEPGPPRGFFDIWSRVYDHPILQWATYRPVHDAVLRTLRVRAPQTILDLGCGTGQLLRRMADELPTRLLVGCDFSAGMLAHAAARLHRMPSTPALVRGDALRLPFRDGSFAAVVSTEAFHWFPDQHAALAELARVLVRDGTLLLGFVNPSFAVVGDVARLGSRLFGTPLHWPTPSALRRTLEVSGFAVTAQRRIFRVPGFLLPPVLTEARRMP